jgi:hypothetical protein
MSDPVSLRQAAVVGPNAATIEVDGPFGRQMPLAGSDAGQHNQLCVPGRLPLFDAHKPSLFPGFEIAPGCARQAQANYALSFEEQLSEINRQVQPGLSAQGIDSLEGEREVRLYAAAQQFAQWPIREALGC